MDLFENFGIKGFKERGLEGGSFRDAVVWFSFIWRCRFFFRVFKVDTGGFGSYRLYGVEFLLFL